MLYMLLILAVGGLCECVTEVKVGGGGIRDCQPRVGVCTACPSQAAPLCVRA